MTGVQTCALPILVFSGTVPCPVREASGSARSACPSRDGPVVDFAAESTNTQRRHRQLMVPERAEGRRMRGPSARVRVGLGSAVAVSALCSMLVGVTPGRAGAALSAPGAAVIPSITDDSAARTGLASAVARVSDVL